MVSGLGQYSQILNKRVISKEMLLIWKEVIF